MHTALGIVPKAYNRSPNEPGSTIVTTNMSQESSPMQLTFQNNSPNLNISPSPASSGVNSPKVMEGIMQLPAMYGKSAMISQRFSPLNTFQKKSKQKQLQMQ